MVLKDPKGSCSLVERSRNQQQGADEYSSVELMKRQYTAWHMAFSPLRLKKKRENLDMQ